MTDEKHIKSNTGWYTGAQKESGGAKLVSYAAFVALGAVAGIVCVLVLFYFQARRHVRQSGYKDPAREARIESMKEGTASALTGGAIAGAVAAGVFLASVNARTRWLEKAREKEEEESAKSPNRDSFRQPWHR